MDSDQTYYELDPFGDVTLILKDCWQDEEDDDPLNGELDDTQQDQSPTPSGPSAKQDQEPIRMQLSSRHLALASDYFRNMFKSRWTGGRQFRCDQPFLVNEKGWKLKPFLLLMNIIHGHARQVPQKVTLNLLSEITILVDYYKCAEVVEFTAETWINQLHKPDLFKQLDDTDSSDSSAPEDSMTWIWISYVFREPYIFSSMTEIAVEETQGQIQTMGLPIPETIVAKLEEQRKEYIEVVVTALHERLVELRAGKHWCSFDCGCKILGALTIGMDRLHLFTPRPVESILSLPMSTEQVLDCLIDFQYPTACCRCCHTLLESNIELCIREFKRRLTGLDLDNFVPG